MICTFYGKRAGIPYAIGNGWDRSSLGCLQRNRRLKTKRRGRAALAPELSRDRFGIDAFVLPTGSLGSSSMARAALGWSVRDLEANPGVGRNTISRYEAGHDILSGALDSLEKVLADQGVVSFEGNGVYGTGVGLKKHQAAKR